MILGIIKGESVKIGFCFNDDSLKNPYMQDFIVKNPIFQTQDLCLCTLDTNLMYER